MTETSIDPMAKYLELESPGAGDDGSLTVYKAYRYSFGKLDVEPCKHAYDIETYVAGQYGDGTRYKQKRWKWPYAVYASNQGGHDCTFVCLDCALEARQRLENGDGEEYNYYKSPYE